MTLDQLLDDLYDTDAPRVRQALEALAAVAASRLDEAVSGVRLLDDDADDDDDDGLTPALVEELPALVRSLKRLGDFARHVDELLA